MAKMSDYCLICTGETVQLIKPTVHQRLLMRMFKGVVYLPTENLRHLSNYFFNDETLDSLTEQEKFVVRMHFGIDTESASLREIGASMNKTSSRMGQIEGKALRKLKHPSRNKKIRGNVFVEKSSLYGENKPYALYKESIIALLKNDIVCFNNNKNYQTIYLKSILEKLMEDYVEIEFAEDLSIFELQMSVRTTNCLIRSNIKTLGQLANLSSDEIKSIRNLGKKSELEIKKFLNNYYQHKKESYKKKNITVEDFVFNPTTIMKTLDDLFEFDFSPELMNVLLFLGYIDIEKIIKDYDLILEFLDKNKTSLVMEFKSIIKRYTEFSVLADMDKALFDFVNEFNINNVDEIKEHVVSIQNQTTREKVRKILRLLQPSEDLKVKGFDFEKDKNVVIDEQETIYYL